MKKTIVVISAIAAGVIGTASAEPGVIGGAAIKVGTEWATGRMRANAESAVQEKTVPAAALKVVTGVSVDAIEKHGPAGGENSVIRRPFGPRGPKLF